MLKSPGIEREVDGLGVCTLTINQQDRSTNVIDDTFIAELSEHIDWLYGTSDEAVKGVLICSGKDNFMVGADLFALQSLLDSVERFTADELFRRLQQFSLVLRRLEKLSKPVVALIDGQALGGGFELALAAHHRILTDQSDSQVGLPEVQVGLLPGGGGTQRLTRRLGIANALPILLEGKSYRADEALRRRMVDAVVPRAEGVKRAKDWLLSSEAVCQAPWDQKGFKFPGGNGAMDPRAVQTFIGATAMTFAKTLGNYPAAQAILSVAYEGSVVSFDRALDIETMWFAKLFQEGTAKRMIRTLFINKGAADKLVRRPPAIALTRCRRLGVLGAGMMGAGIAYVAAQAGVAVTLLDRDLETAGRGKSFAATQLRKLVDRGRLGEAEANEIIERITPGTDYADLKDVDLVIEAVFEDREVKAEVTRRAHENIRADCVFASNTSTLPISGLASVSPTPDQFIGIHFFSPVEKMPLVEVIRGERTGERALAVALDFIRLLKKTPIVVNDGRGFFTTRFVSAYILEGQAMLLEGIPPALIEYAGRAAGMPVGPLALADEVALDLSWKIREQWKKDLGADYVSHPGEVVNDVLVVEHGRYGRKNGMGFYDYLPAGGEKVLWPELGRLFPSRQASLIPTAKELSQRLLLVQALEAVRCLESGVLQHPDDGDVGAVFGLGFAPFTGGPLSWIESIGFQEFMDWSDKAAKTHGDRYRAPVLLQSLVSSGAARFARD